MTTASLKNVMQYALLLLVLSTFVLDITSAKAVVTSSSYDSNRSKREIYFRPLFVYKQQQRNRQRQWKIQALYLQQQNTDQQHLQDYPSVPISDVVDYRPTLPLQQQLSYQQQYEQQYYQQYYNKYFQTFPKNSFNSL